MIASSSGTRNQSDKNCKPSDSAIFSPRHLKVVFLVRSLHRGGTERQLVLLATELCRLGCEVKVAVFYSGGELEAELKQAGVPIVDLRKGGRWDLVGCLARLIRYVRREKPEVLLSHLPDANVLAALAKPFIKPTKLVWEVRASDVPTLKGGDWAARASFAGSCRLSSIPDLIVFNSRAGEQFHLLGGYHPKRAVVIPNGFDTDFFSPRPLSREQVRAEWGVPANAWLIGLVGRFDPIKGHELFLNAAALLARKRADVRFVLVGEGSPERASQLRTLALSNHLENSVIWAGERGDMPAVYSALDILTLSSLAEGFPNAVGEAMACETPCVVCRVGDAAEIVGETGAVVPTGEPVRLEEGWMALMSESASQFALREKMARARILERFSVNRLTGATFQALSDLS